MSDNKQIIDLYSTLADSPQTDFGWEKGLSNAKAHGYKEEWFEKLPPQIWDYCAAVGNPFSVGAIDKGLTVLDLGCGAGVDLLVSAYLVGENGKAIGIDITPKMVQKSKEHALLSGFKNIEVYEGNFDNLPLEDSSIDIVISNGAINLTSCKESVFDEIYRVLKDDAKIYIADMIDISITPTSCTSMQSNSCSNEENTDWANCVAGTLIQEEFIKIIQNSGFKDVACTGLTHYTTAETTQGATFKATKISSKEKTKSHWNQIFTSKDSTQVLWHQNDLSKSIKLMKRYSDMHSQIIDIGSGTSLLVNNLLSNKYQNITLLDTSEIALNIVKKRLENKDVTYICEDIVDFKSTIKYNIWHDRAVFHFLTSQAQREKYFQVLYDSLEDDGVAILSTFALGKEMQCAGLNTVQYDYETMLKELPTTLKIVANENYTHVTPKQTTQDYIYFIIQKI